MENFFGNASNVMTVVSFITFLGIVWWAQRGNWEEAAKLPFADEEKDHG
ncbi:cbb3-type cytochrome oxidase subunit 3 [Pseudoduganella sp. HUAS MS19]